MELPGIVDEFGETATSAAVEWIDADPSAIVSQTAAAKPARRGKWQETGLAVLDELSPQWEDGIVPLEEWREACMATGMIKSTFYRMMRALSDKGDIDLSDVSVIRCESR